MKLKTLVKHICILVTLLLCHSTNASIIKQNDFSLDTSTNIITGNGLNWTRWDTLAGFSINQALTLYSADGWRLASSDEMIGMYSHFLSGIDWSSARDENTEVGDIISEDDYRDLVAIFGVSIHVYGGTSSILFGNDLDNDGTYRSATALYTDYDPVAWISAVNSRYTVDFSSGYYSVQLVRAINVSEPKQIYLFILLILLLLATKYRKDIC